MTMQRLWNGRLCPVNFRFGLRKPRYRKISPSPHKLSMPPIIAPTSLNS